MNDRQVSMEEGLKFAEEHGFLYREGNVIYDDNRNEKTFTKCFSIYINIMNQLEN